MWDLIRNRNRKHWYLKWNSLIAIYTYSFRSRFNKKLPLQKRNSKNVIASGLLSHSMNECLHVQIKLPNRFIEIFIVPFNNWWYQHLPWTFIQSLMVVLKVRITENSARSFLLHFVLKADQTWWLMHNIMKKGSLKSNGIEHYCCVTVHGRVCVCAIGPFSILNYQL